MIFHWSDSKCFKTAGSLWLRCLQTKHTEKALNVPLHCSMKDFWRGSEATFVTATDRLSNTQKNICLWRTLSPIRTAQVFKKKKKNLNETEDLQLCISEDSRVVRSMMSEIKSKTQSCDNRQTSHFIWRYLKYSSKPAKILLRCVVLFHTCE